MSILSCWVLSKFIDNLCMFHKVAGSQKYLFWVLTIPEYWGEWENYHLLMMCRDSKNENCSLCNVGCYLYTFDGIKKVSIASVYNTFQLAKKGLNLCYMITPYYITP